MNLFIYLKLKEINYPFFPRRPVIILNDPGPMSLNGIGNVCAAHERAP